MSEELDTEAEELEQRLAEVRRLQASARRSMLTEGWMIEVLWGVIFLVSVPAAFLLDGNLMWFWTIAGFIGGVASFTLGLRAEVQPNTPAWPYLVVAAAMFVGAFGSFYVFQERMAILAWWAVLLSGFIVFALLDGQRALAIGLIVMIVWGVVTFGVIDDVGTLYAVLATSLGAAYLGAGAAFRTVR
jgi:hypothetical protein